VDNFDPTKWTIEDFEFGKHWVAASMGIFTRPERVTKLIVAIKILNK
jgi:hypothetical protein